VGGAGAQSAGKLAAVKVFKKHAVHAQLQAAKRQFIVQFCSAATSRFATGPCIPRPTRNFYAVGFFDPLSLKSLRTKLGLRAVWITSATTTWPE
jgi:hypothetical protein